MTEKQAERLISALLDISGNLRLLTLVGLLGVVVEVLRVLPWR